MTVCIFVVDDTLYVKPFEPCSSRQPRDEEVEKKPEEEEKKEEEEKSEGKWTKLSKK